LAGFTAQHFRSLVLHVYISIVRLIFLFCFVKTCIIIKNITFYYSFLPESARWLASRKRYSEAKEIFLEAAKINKKILPANLLVIPDSNNQINQTEKDNNSPLIMLIEMLKTPCLLKRILILAFAWYISNSNVLIDL